MTFDEYHKKALSTVDEQSNDEFQIYMARVLGIVGEAGEVADKFKKIVWHREGVVNEEDKEEIKKELGDVLWYVAALSDALGFTLEEVATTNISKLKYRKENNLLRGDGDNR
ncbi:nucleoside triphosphate pyrophosphohydrolase family protein [Candidatus Woesearchaeota archaeon]|nr:nucleoside triphosphate pyrophosphohydrolase family protein [Candidatus Woesearchaeota archaeon]